MKKKSGAGETKDQKIADMSYTNDDSLYVYFRANIVHYISTKVCGAYDNNRKSK